MHADQLDIDASVARELIDTQFPQWRDLPIHPVGGQGTVNAIFRLGDRLAARFPLLPANPDKARATLDTEAAAARELAGRTPFATPEPVAIGAPGARYPMPWSVQTWLPGRVATCDEPAGSTGYARDLADFILAARSVDTRGRTFSGEGRGGELPEHDEWVALCLRESVGLVDVPRLADMWAELRELPRDAPDVMSHGDLIPGNVLVADGRLVGVLDVGGFGPADPALDLVAAWHLLDDEPRAVLRAALECDELTWARGRAWALQQALGTVWYYVDTNPPMALMGRRTIERLLAAS